MIINNCKNTSLAGWMTIDKMNDNNFTCNFLELLDTLSYPIKSSQPSHLNIYN